MTFGRKQMQWAVAYGAQLLRGCFPGMMMHLGETPAAKLQSPIACTKDSLRNLLPDGTRLLLSQKLEENSTFHVPESEIAYTQSPSGLRALCALQVEVAGDNDSTYSFGLFLPEEWNGRFLGVGNGAFAGGVNWADMTAGSQYGFASMSTDTGHHSGFQDGSWAWQNPDAVDNWGHKAMHGSVQAAKSIVRAFYKSNGKHVDISSSYYSGCSTGGRQGLKEAQEYPEDFDGILAGAPAWWSKRLHLFNLVAGVFNLPVEAAHHIPPKMFPVIAEETLRQCDPQDGVRDYIISSPETCLLQLETLLCGPGSDASKCLMPAQLETLHKLYNDWVEANSTFVFPHLLPGSEWEWTKLSGSDKPNSLGVDYVKYFLNLGPDWDWKQGYSPSLLQLAEEMDPGNATADNYDLSPFFKRGGKLMLYHGLADPGIPPGSTLYFYNQVVQTLMPRGINVSDHSRVLLRTRDVVSRIDPLLTLYLFSSDLHITRHRQESPAANEAPWYFAGANQQAALKGPIPRSVPGFSDAKHDAMLALIDWVEKGRAPTEIIATKWADDDPQGRVISQRPLCMYPKVARFHNSGGLKGRHADVKSPKNWVCKDLWD